MHNKIKHLLYIIKKMINEDFPIEENSTIKDLNIKDEISNILKQKKKNHLIGKEVVNKLDSKIKKERLLLQLIQEYNFHKKDQKDKEENLIDVTTKREHFQNNLKATIHFHNQIKEQVGEFLEEIEICENKIKELNNERDNITSTSFSLMQKKSEEKKNLQKQITEIEGKINQQIDLINNLNKKYEDLVKQKENEEKNLMSQDKLNIERYNSLYKRYKDMLNKYNIYEQEEDNKLSNDLEITKKAYEDNLLKEDLKIKLTEEKIKNEFLQKNMDYISNKVNLVTKDENANLLKMSGFKKYLSPKTNASTIYSTTIGNNSKY